MTDLGLILVHGELAKQCEDAGMRMYYLCNNKYVDQEDVALS